MNARERQREEEGEKVGREREGKGEGGKGEGGRESGMGEERERVHVLKIK